MLMWLFRNAPKLVRDLVFAAEQLFMPKIDKRTPTSGPQVI
jgi:hypothetical protein